MSLNSFTNCFFSTLRTYSRIFKYSNYNLNVTDLAFDHLNVLKRKFPEKALRIAVEPGGCHGFQYKFSLEPLQEQENNNDPKDHSPQNSLSDDLVFLSTQSNDPNILSIICDNVSWSLIKDAKLDYTCELIGSKFRIIDNPVVESGCGCGVSFDLKK